MRAWVRSLGSMMGLGAVWAFLGLPGLREVVVVALVALVLYGRSGVLQTRHARALRPWLAAARRASAPRPSAAPKPRAKWGDRLFWFLAITAATAVAAWVVTRTMIAGGSGLPH